MGLRGFEKRVESIIEGAFARAFRSGLRPVEIGRRLIREMDDHRSVGVRGATVVPNSFRVRLSAEDREQFADMASTLERELAEAAREHARDEVYTFVGPVSVVTEVDDGMRPGAFQIDVAFQEGPGGAGAGSLVLPTGDRIPLGEHTVTIGRRPECTIVLGDPNVSRNHAEVRPHGIGFVVVDLGSTNGTRVNGMRVTSHPLVDGDDIAFGSTHVRFEAS
ncbi:MAG: DUF3662 and FHA domain-containing protein [Actinobacteria bacterium]|nr:DUF3662 and FHA domain-containing protein [Actinomycetota bacterium]